MKIVNNDQNTRLTVKMLRHTNYAAIIIMIYNSFINLLEFMHKFDTSFFYLKK